METVIVVVVIAMVFGAAWLCVKDIERMHRQGVLTVHTDRRRFDPVIWLPFAAAVVLFAFVEPRLLAYVAVVYLADWTWDRARFAYVDWRLRRPGRTRTKSRARTSRTGRRPEPGSGAHA